ncbi:PREDICTED: E3 ubiquitin-protein ligase AIP2 [Nelumbo nucifera]|uniref:RING-type E3 ubiquitin transferase n=2 Tax=Nelumbo nucifera TaxID=4432 RepID=A0A1U8A3M9_NELNU|nr:PREDICTED: E3 ubiquitin-protein ligase AIP2 [Nelumbo nucifera]DAD44169.1 TPA_asm: hypothetical protein HUJ06_002399 [Nelumbo nucifera]
MASSEDSLKERLQDLQKQLGKKQKFEEAVSSIKSLLIETYPSASPTLRKPIYSTVCRVATILQTRYTIPGFWLAGLGLFQEAERLVLESSERQHLKTCIARAREHLHELENRPESDSEHNRPRDSRYLFEGHLTVDPEPSRPAWLVAQDLLATISAAESSQGQTENINTPEITEQLINMIDPLELEAVIQNSLQEFVHQRRPPAGKEVVAKLPIITVTEEVLAKFGSETCCAICLEKFVPNDKLQELPCKNMFHPPCLKPWLDENNSCPVCRYELQTDDYEYERRKEREKEAEEERKGAANAIRGGEYMYV